MYWHAQYIAELSAFIRVWLYVVYPAVKLLAYIGWCHWGAACLDVKPGRSSIGAGAIRFLIGLAFGGAVYLIAMAVGPEKVSRLYELIRPQAVYAAVFLPIRWVEWWIMEHVMACRPEPLLSASPRALRWRIGGILISFASDAPLFLFINFLGAIA